MDNSDANGEAEQRRSGGAFFRHLLRNVRPEHVAEMIDMLHRMQDPDRPIMVPREGPWAMKMPEGYLLLGEGPMGFDIEPPPAPPARWSESDVVPRLDKRDTERIMRLAQAALKMKRPERDDIVAQLFALDFDQCEAEAVRAVEG